MSLSGRHVVLGVSGGVAAYKSVILCRLLVEAGASVRVVMTETAQRFIGAPTLAALTGTAPIVSLFDNHDSVSPHTELGRWADLVVVAPATTATIARLATGLTEDALSATVLASTAPLLIAPAMHTEMWEHPSTQRNIGTLRSDGAIVIGPDRGALAGGDEGVGRMAEPESIVRAAQDRITFGGSLAGLTVLVTAGGTREAIDPVRYIGNRSSGKMGHAIADEAARRGAAVILVTTSDLPTLPGVKRIEVESASDMDRSVRDAEDVDVAVMAAAVADFRPVDPADSKMSRADGPPSIVLESTPDVLAGVAARPNRPFLIGFAAETGHIDRAVAKAASKGVDLLVANDVSQVDAGFSVDTNRVVIIWPDGRTEPWELASKSEVAARMWDLFERLNLAEPDEGR